MKIIYAKKSSGIDEQGSFQNPEYYAKPDQTATEVIVYGDYSQIVADYEELGINPEVRELAQAEQLTVSVDVGITPELQAVIDEAKAECEKVVAENDQLKEQITVMEQASKVHSDLIAEHSRLNDLLQISDDTNQVSLEQLQVAKGEFIAFQNDVVAMKKRIAELEPIGVDKKLTAAEVKASKAEQPKE